MSLVAHDKLQLYYKDDESSIEDMTIPDNTTTNLHGSRFEDLLHRQEQTDIISCVIYLLMIYCN